MSKVKTVPFLMLHQEAVTPEERGYQTYPTIINYDPQTQIVQWGLPHVSDGKNVEVYATGIFGDSHPTTYSTIDSLIRVGSSWGL